MSNVILKTSLGTIEIELFDKEAPETVKNFLSYVNSGFYDNTIFHRIINGFMVQGGGFTTEFKEKKTAAPIQNEAANKLSNKRGTIAMARTSDPHSATAQFFINLVDNAFLDYKSSDVRGFGYCVFGAVTKGLDVIDKMAVVPTGNHGFHQDVPRENIVILSAKEF